MIGGDATILLLILWNERPTASLTDEVDVLVDCIVWYYCS